MEQLYLHSIYGNDYGLWMRVNEVHKQSILSPRFQEDQSLLSTHLKYYCSTVLLYFIITLVIIKNKN